MLVFEFSQLIIGIFRMNTVHDIIPILIWFIPFVQSITSQVKYLLGRQELLSFFDDFHNLEEEIDLRNKPQNHIIKSIKTTRLVAMFYYVFMWIGLLMGLAYIIIQFPESPFLLSTHHWITATLGLTLIRFIHIFDLVLHFISTSLADIVPAMVFYHISLKLRLLTEELSQVAELCFKSETQISHVSKSCFQPLSEKITFSAHLRCIWLKFGDISKIVERANTLFGPLILFDHGVKFFLTCTMLYLTLYHFQKATFQAEVYFIKLIIISINLVLCNLLASQLYCASTNMKKKLLSLMNEHWDSIEKQDKDTLNTFLNQVQQEELAACPLNLYQITPSMLLTTLSLTVSYVIVLIQSK